MTENMVVGHIYGFPYFNDVGYCYDVLNQYETIQK